MLSAHRGHAESPSLALMVMRSGLRMIRDDGIACVRRTIDRMIEAAKPDSRPSVLEVRLLREEGDEGGLHIFAAAGQIGAPMAKDRLMWLALAHRS